MAGALVDETGRRQLRVEAIAEDLGEPALVVVEPLLCLIVDASNIDNDVASVKNSRIARALKVCVGPIRICVFARMRARTSVFVRRSLAKHVDSKSLIAVEGAVVGADDLEVLFNIKYRDDRNECLPSCQASAF